MHRVTRAVSEQLELIITRAGGTTITSREDAVATAAVHVHYCSGRLPLRPLDLRLLQSRRDCPHHALRHLILKSENVDGVVEDIIVKRTFESVCPDVRPACRESQRL